MKRTELHPLLQQEYRKGLSSGVAKVQATGLENTWFVIPPPPPEQVKLNLSRRIMIQANEALSSLSKIGKASDLESLTTSLLVRREAVQSSRMEGTWSTIDAVLTPSEVLLDSEKKSERASVLGYAHALESHLQQCSKKGASALTEILVCSLHRTIMEKDPHFRSEPGKIRKSVVFIGGALRKENSIYNPAPPTHVSRCFREIMHWYGNSDLVEMGDAGMGLSLLMRMAIGHSHFEAVHPFMDGNGRVGRMLMALQMACSHLLPLYLSGFIEHEKLEYYKTLSIAQKKLKYEPFIEFIATAVIQSHQEAEESRKSLSALPDLWIQQGGFRAQSTSQRALHWLLSHPIFTAQQLESDLKVSKPAAQKAVKQLVDSKIVRERTGKIKNRVYAAEAVIEILARNFNETPKLALERAALVLRQK